MGRGRGVRLGGTKIATVGLLKSEMPNLIYIHGISEFAYVLDNGQIKLVYDLLYNSMLIIEMYVYMQIGRRPIVLLHFGRMFT